MVDPALKIGDDVFVVSPLLGEESFLLQPKLMPIVADCMTGFFAMHEKVADGQLDYVALADKLSPLVQSIASKLPIEELRFIMRALLRGATMNGQQLYTPAGNPIDVLLQQRSLDVWRLLFHAVKVSYPDFFQAARRVLAGAAAAQPASSSATSTTSSPGPSGGS